MTLTAAILFASQGVALADSGDGRGAGLADGVATHVATPAAQASSQADSIPLHAWRVVAVEGEAHMLLDTGQSIGWTALQAGQQLPPNVQIETGSESQVLLFNGSDAITVYSDTRLGLPEIMADTTAVDVYQGRGRADYQVRDRASEFSFEDLFIGVGRLFRADEAAEDRFKVFAPRLTTVVKGTVFTVTVLRDRTDVRVSDGVVEVMDPRSGDDAEVLAGQMATARPDVAAGVRLRYDAEALIDPSAKVPSTGQTLDRSGPGNERDEGDDTGDAHAAAGGPTGGGESSAMAGTGGEAGGAESAGLGAGGGGPAAAGSGEGDTYSVAGGPDGGSADGGAAASEISSASASASASSGSAGGRTGGSGGTGAASGGSSEGGGEVAASEAGDGGAAAEASAASAGSGSGRSGYGGGSITISGTGPRGSFSTTISRDGISTTYDESSSEDRSLTVSGSGESGSFSTTYSSDGVERTVSGPDAAGATE